MAGKIRPSLRAKTLQNVALSNLSLADKKCIEEVFKKFEELATADVEEVKHGKWIEDGDYQVCSVCGEEHHWDEYRATYCEDCGAKMDGGS